MMRLFLFLAFLLAAAAPASAQYAVIVNQCGSRPLTPGGTAQATIDVNGNLCATGAAGTASLAASEGAVAPPVPQRPEDYR